MSVRRIGTERRNTVPARLNGGFIASMYGTAAPTAWYSVDSILGSRVLPPVGTALTTWYDSSGNGYFLTLQTGTATFDGSGSVVFNAGRMFSTPFARPTDYTAYILCRKTVTTQVGLLSADGAAPRWWQWYADASGAVGVECFTGTSTSQGLLKSANSVNAASTWYALTMLRSAASGTVVRQNSTQIAVNATSTPGAGGSTRGLILGGNYDALGTFTGQINQAVLYPEAHSSGTMATIEAALLASVA